MGKRVSFKAECSWLRVGWDCCSFSYDAVFFTLVKEVVAHFAYRVHPTRVYHRTEHFMWFETSQTNHNIM